MGVAISAGQKIFLNGEIVLCVGLGRWLWLWAAFWGAVAVCVAVWRLPSVGVSVALFGANKKAGARLGFRFGCVSILRQ